ncbi:MAG: hypothetical protein Kow0069_05810 [Promethearchaeota archaeon]
MPGGERGGDGGGGRGSGGAGGAGEGGAGGAGEGGGGPSDRETFTRFSISLPSDLLEEFDRFTQRRGSTRSEAIRKAMRAYVAATEWEELRGTKSGSITVIAGHDYEHESNHTQHDFKDVIVATTHVHLPDDNCLEVVVVRGDASRIKQLYDALSKIKGVLTSGYTVLK